MKPQRRKHPLATAFVGDMLLLGKSLWKSAIVKNPQILHGTPVFRSTRVPVKALFDSLEAGETLEEFLQGFPS